MSLAVTILIGVGIGIIVEFLLPGHTRSEFALAVVLGVAGALVARYLGERAGWFGTEEPDSLIASVLGSIGALLLYIIIFRRNGKPSGR